MIPVTAPRAFEDRVYSTLQIFGGWMLIMVFLGQLAGSSNGLGLITTAGLAAVGGASIVLGVWWLEQRDRRAARWCFLIWIVQVLVFASPMLSYSFFSGALLSVSLQLPHVGLSISTPRLGVEFVARLDREGPVSYVGLNLVAVAASLYFFRQWRKPGGQEALAAPSAKP